MNEYYTVFLCYIKNVGNYYVLFLLKYAQESNYNTEQYSVFLHMNRNE